MSSRDFLVELGTEELPPKQLPTLEASFKSSIQDYLTNVGIEFDSISSFAAPRRLAVLIKGLREQGQDSTQELQGPPVKIAYDSEGAPTKAAIGWAQSNDVAVESLGEKDGRLYVLKEVKGAIATDHFKELVEQAILKLPAAKKMRWADNEFEFVRPIKWLVCLFGDEQIDMDLGIVRSGRITRGHRFHASQEIEIKSASDYEASLETEGKIYPSFAKRRAMIAEQVEAEGKKLGGVAVIEEDLLDEVTALNELPVALSGAFDQEFLDVPAQALISSMKEHQKYFHVEDKDGNLMANFITVANLQSKDPQQVIEGNEKVIRPRLADAAFFWNTDRKSSLESRVEKLKTVVFQNQLGTIYDKAVRIAGIGKVIADQIDEDNGLVQRAALLAKADLMTEMVYEFPDLQGIAGYHYALHDGEHEDVAAAMNEQYLPRQAGDELPQTKTGMILAIADRLDSLVGLFGIGQPPTGTKDPFALRRASLGVLRILVENKLDLDLRLLLETAVKQHKDLPKADTVVEDVLSYMLDRFSAWFQDEKIPTEVFMAVRARDLSNPLDINNRVQAVHQFSQMEAAPALSAANKRVSNILSKQGAEDISGELNQSLLTESAEQKLAKAVAEKSEQVKPLFAASDYAGALTALSELRETVDGFFDSVMVMADDEAVRQNRLLLLNQLRSLFLEVADISLLQN